MRQKVIAIRNNDALVLQDEINSLIGKTLEKYFEDEITEIVDSIQSLSVVEQMGGYQAFIMVKLRTQTYKRRLT